MKLTKEEFRHHVLRNQKKRRHLTKKKAFLATLYQSKSQNFQIVSSVFTAKL